VATQSETGVARTAQELERTLVACRAGFELRRARVVEARDWSLAAGALQHRSGGFFSVNGVRIADDTRVMLYQPQAAVTGLVTAQIGRERAFLLQGRAEPGCLGEAQFGPTVQTTPANYLRLHGGTAAPYAEAFLMFAPSISTIDDTVQLDLGERYVFKSKRSILVEEACPQTPRSAFVWASPAALGEAVRRSTFLNIDLRSFLSIAKWSNEPCDDALVPASSEARRSLAAPVRTEVLASLLAMLYASQRARIRFVPLDAVDNWIQTEWGWSEKTPRQRFTVDFYEVKAAHREVGCWIQPLVNSVSQGDAILAVREGGRFIEFFVRVISERGLATGAAVGPSYLRYPGDVGEVPDWLAPPRAEVWSATIESDEGGRFYQDASAYALVRVGDAPNIPHGAWLRLSELKALLSMSNVCAIQLRGLVSQLLGAA